MSKRRSNKAGQESVEWLWICEWAHDSMGIGRWFPRFNLESSKRAKVTLRAIESQEEGYWRIEEHDHDRDADREEQDASAASGFCPSCKKNSKKTKKGRSKGFVAFRCGSCSHVWRLMGTRDPGYVPTVRSKPLQKTFGGPLPKLNGKKLKKGKKKDKKGKKKGKKS